MKYIGYDSNFHWLSLKLSENTGIHLLLIDNLSIALINIDDINHNKYHLEF